MNTDISTVFRSNVSMLMAAEGHTYLSVAARIGLSDNSFGNIGRYLHGQVQPTIRTVARFAAALGVPPHVLLDPDGLVPIEIEVR